MKQKTVTVLISAALVAAIVAVVGVTAYDIYRTVTGPSQPEAKVSRAIPTCAIRGHKGGCVYWK